MGIDAAGGAQHHAFGIDTELPEDGEGRTVHAGLRDPKKIMTQRKQAAQESGVAVAVLTAFQQEFASAGAPMVLAGGGTPRGMELCLAANGLNRSRGAVGTTIKPGEAITSFEGIDSPSQLRAAAQRMQSGSVPLVMIRNVNPSYSMPKASGFTAAMAKVPFKVSFSSIPDETSAMADLVLPDNHSLESWGDAEPVRGTLSLQQPVMDPVFDTRATADVLLAVTRASGAAGTPPDYRTVFISRFPGGADGLAAALPKGIANGMPIAACLATVQVADSWKAGNISTFGGNPITTAAASATIDVIVEERLADNATVMGKVLRDGLEGLQKKYAKVIGDVRGMGLMIGVELVRDRKSKEPANTEAADVMEKAKERGLIIGKGGLFGNTLRIKPPMCLNKDDADFLVDTLDEVLLELKR